MVPVRPIGIFAIMYSTVDGARPSSICVLITAGEIALTVSQTLEPRGDRLGPRAVSVEDRNPGSRRVQPAGNSRPDPLPGAGHERHLAGQIKESRHGNAPESTEREEVGTLPDLMKTYQVCRPFATLTRQQQSVRRT